MSPQKLSPKAASGDRLMRQGLFRDAERDFTDAIAAHGADLEALLGLARLHLARNDAGAARPFLEQLQQLVPGHRESLSVLLRLEVEAGDDKALSKLRALAGRKDAGFFEAFNFGRAMLSKGKSAQAVAAFNQAVKKEPRSAHAFTLLGKALLDAGELDRARKAFLHAHTLAPRELAPLELAARVLIRQGRLGKAIVVLHRAVTQVAPDNARLWEELARLFLASNNPKKAAKAAFELRARSPGSAQGAYLQGLATLLGGNPAEAERLFLEAVELSPESPEPRLALAKAKRYRKDDAGAARVLEEAVECFPSDPGPAMDLALLYLEQPGKPDAARAREVLERALKKNPAHAGLHLNLALALADPAPAASREHAQRALDEATDREKDVKAQATRLLEVLATQQERSG